MKVMENRNCALCNTIFEINVNNKRDNNRMACSRQCSATINGRKNLGKKRTEEFKQRLRETFSGNGNPFAGKTHSEKSLELMSFSSKWSYGRLNKLELNDIDKEIIDGLLLGDGSMSEYSKVSSRLTFGFKFKESCQDIINALPTIKFSPIWESTGKYKSYHVKSSYYPLFLLENKRWYNDRIKIIPHDIRITPISCYWWFIGDGYVHAPNIFIATDCFSENDLNILIQKFNNLAFYPKIIKGNRLIFHRNCAIKFMNWLKDNNKIHPQYQYKWDNFFNNLSENTCVRKHWR